MYQLLSDRLYRTDNGATENPPIAIGTTKGDKMFHGGSVLGFPLHDSSDEEGGSDTPATDANKTGLDTGDQEDDPMSEEKPGGATSEDDGDDDDDENENNDDEPMDPVSDTKCDDVDDDAEHEDDVNADGKNDDVDMNEPTKSN